MKKTTRIGSVDPIFNIVLTRTFRHIGCDESSRCGYYQDRIKHSTVPAKAYPDFIPGAETYIKDRQGSDTRCSRTGLDLIEKFDGSHWVHHFKCLPGTSCNDILGSGACRADDEYTIPTDNHLWIFKCPDASDEKTCRFSKSQAIDAQGLPKSFKPIGTTQCSSNNRTVQDINGKDIYSCAPEATCTEKGDYTGCQPLRLAIRESSYEKGYTVQS